MKNYIAANFKIWVTTPWACGGHDWIEPRKRKKDGQEDQGKAGESKKYFWAPPTVRSRVPTALWLLN